MKMAYVAPIFKKGARKKAENYKAISYVNCVQIDEIIC